MAELDVILLSRVQFAFTIAYHIVFPSMSIGLALYLAVQRTLYQFTGGPNYRQTYDFWLKIFGLTFGMGVVTGVVLSYEIGTNWGNFAERAGPIVGPLMSFEVMTAFFLEAGFLGIMLLGQQRVDPRVYLFATWMVALGTLISAFWILSANSFMHTPDGYIWRDGSLQAHSWLDAIFNPSFPYRFTHMVTAAYLSTGFIVAGTGAWLALNTVHREFGLRQLRTALGVVAVLAPLQVFLGDQHGLNTLEHQPVKVAAMEANWQTRRDVPLLLFAWPDQAAEENRWELSVPYLASLILTHDPHGEVPGLVTVPPEDRPPVAVVFWSFRLMVGCGLLMLLLAWAGVWLLWRGRLADSARYLRCLQWASPLGLVAILAGWVTTEVGRQPWTVQGLIRTTEAATPLPAVQVALTLSLFIVVYALFLGVFLVYFRQLVYEGPPSTTAAEGH